MGELLNICAILEGQQPTDERRALVSRLLVIAEPWIGDAQMSAINRFAVPDFYEAPWADGEAYRMIPDLILPGTLVHVYTRHANGASGVLTIEQANSLSSIAASVPLTAIRGHTLDEIESLITEIYLAASAQRRAVVVAGPEVEVDVGAGTFEEVIRRSLKDSSLIAFVVGSPQLVPPGVPGYSRATVASGAVRLRHRHAAERLWLGDVAN